MLKLRIEYWNCDVFGWIDLRVSDKVKELNDLDKIMVDNFGCNLDKLVEHKGMVEREMWEAPNL